MAYTTINKSTAHFNTKLYTGNGNSNHAQTGVGFQPDLLWNKSRSSGDNHLLFDAVRGSTKSLSSDTISAEVTRDSTFLTSFDSDGFTVGSNGNINGSGATFANWCWKGNGAGSANTDGSVTSTVSVNQSAGFSIVSWTGTGSNLTVGHGLNKTPEMIITMNRDNGNGYWVTYHKDTSASPQTSYIYLAVNSPKVDGYADFWNSTAPTSSVFYIGTDGDMNTNGEKMIAYCFSSITGYQKVGSFIGNANVDGPMIVTGFKPSFILIKNVNATQSWRLVDNKRIGYNPNNIQLYPDITNTESTSEYVVDIVSNGFKVRATDAGVNGSGNTMIYIAIGQSIVGSNNVPCTAR